MQLQWSESGKVGRWVRRDHGALQAALRTWAFPREPLKGSERRRKLSGTFQRLLLREQMVGQRRRLGHQSESCCNSPDERRGRWHRRDNLEEETNAQTQIEL